MNNNEMLGWTKFDDKYPNKFPCKGRNERYRTEDIILNIDKTNKAFKHACFCKSLGVMSMPFTHWKELAKD